MKASTMATLFLSRALHPGQREESVFVVRDTSTNLLAAVNAFIARTSLRP